VLFHRDFLGYTGGHQKVADYFSHLQKSAGYKVNIAFSARTVWDASNPWFPKSQQAVVPFSPAAADALFLAGLDWKEYLRLGVDPNKPVVNLIQHVRHGDPSQNVYPFLKQKAVRICVSQQVADAIAGKANGPVHVIANAHEVPNIVSLKTIELLVVGGKRSALARQLGRVFQAEIPAADLCVLDQFVSREALLAKMAAARVVLLLPNETEGFYLPALEVMQLADVTVVPDCVGNRDFCQDGVNCLRPEYTFEALLLATRQALTLLGDKEVCVAMRRRAQQTVAQHSLASERAQFLKIMDNLDQVW